MFLYFLPYSYAVFTIIFTQHTEFLVYIFAAILCLQCTVHAMLFLITNVSYFHIYTSRKHVAVSSKAVFFAVSFLYFSVMLFRYFLNDLQTVPVAPVTTVGTIFILTSTYTVFYCQVFTFKSFRLISLLHFCLLKFQCLLTDKLLSQNHALQ